MNSILYALLGALALLGRIVSFGWLRGRGSVLCAGEGSGIVAGDQDGYGLIARGNKNPNKNSGLSMPEIMLGLALIAVVTAGGIVAFNQVQPRVAANNIMSGFNAFNVDMVRYLTEYHTDRPGNQTEALAQAMARVPFVAAGADQVDTIPSAVGTCAANMAMTACAAVVPGCSWNAMGMSCDGTPAVDPNGLRFAGLPSLRYGDGGYDEDDDEEWHIPISANAALELQFEIIPSTTPFGHDAADWANCPLQDTTGVPDTAVAVQVDFDNKAVCDNVATALAQFDHVEQAFCLDDETEPPLSTGTTYPKGGVALNICYGVQQ